MEEVHRLTPTEFEYFSKHLLTELGYSEVLVSPKFGTFHADGGVDIYAKHNGHFVVGQCKHWAKGRAGYMPIEQVRALGGSMKEKNASEGVFISTLPYGRHTRIYAMNVGMTLIGPYEIASVMKKVNPLFKARSSFFHRLIAILGLRQLLRQEILPRVYALVGLIILLAVLPYVFPWVMRLLIGVVDFINRVT